MKRLLCALLVLAPTLAFGQASLGLNSSQGFKILTPTNFLNTNFISTRQVKVNHYSGQDDIARSYTTKAWSNIWSAASNSVFGDLINADAGFYPMVTSADTIKLPDGVSLAGVPGQTFITWTNNQASIGMINPGNNSVIEGIHFRAYATFGSGGILKMITTVNSAGNKFWSNAVFRRCVFEGQTDAYAPSGATPVSTKFWNSYFTGQWDLLVTSGSPNYTEYNGCVFDLNGQGRDALDPDQVTIDWSLTVLKTSSGSTNIFNHCWLVATNAGVPTVIDLESGVYIVRDSSSTGYHTNWTVFNNCTFGAAGSNGLAFGGSMFGGKETNAWINSNNVIRFYGCEPQQYYPPVGAYGMFEANTICGNWGDGNVYMPNASTRIYRLPNAGPNGKPFFDGEEITIIDGGGTAAGTNITVTTRGNQKINNIGTSVTAINANFGRTTFRVMGTNWIVVASYP